MMLAGVIYYFSSGRSGMTLPVTLNPVVTQVVTQYLAPVVFLGGLGMCLYGFFQKIRG
jgi:hypothetical protein